eukprot:g73092.t1
MAWCDLFSRTWFGRARTEVAWLGMEGSFRDTPRLACQWSRPKLTLQELLLAFMTTRATGIIPTKREQQQSKNNNSDNSRFREQDCSHS